MRIEDVSLAQHEVHEEVCIVQPAVATAIENRAERETIQFLFMCVAVPRVGLILYADVPIQALVPLKRVVLGSKIDVVVVVRIAVVGVRHRIKIQNVLSNWIDLVRAEYIRLAIASKWFTGVSGVRLIEGDWLGRR